MNLKPIAILAACALLTAGCNKSPTSPTANNSNSQPPPVQAEAFHGQVYKSVDGRHVVTLTSKDECELTKTGTTLLCKYTKQADALRVIATVMGTPQVLYFRFIDQGLQANDGQVLLAPRQYADAIAQLEKQRREQEQQQAKEQMERERIAKEIADSKLATRTISKYTLPTQRAFDQGRPYFDLQRALALTDVSLAMHIVNHPLLIKGPDVVIGDDVILFSQIRKIYDLGEGNFTDFYNGNISVPNNGFFVECEPKKVNTTLDQVVNGKSADEARAIHDAVLDAYNAWKMKFPDAVLK